MLSLCSSLKPLGAADGSCYRNVTVAERVLPLAFRAVDLTTGKASLCPSVRACSEPTLTTNRYCIHCPYSYPSNPRLTCVAGSGASCWVLFQVRCANWGCKIPHQRPNDFSQSCTFHCDTSLPCFQGKAATLPVCKSLPRGAAVGACFTTIKSGVNNVPLQWAGELTPPSDYNTTRVCPTGK